jgi:hypothetical protein
MTAEPDPPRVSPMATDTHECPGGCGRQVARRLLACKPCWFRLPKIYRLV